MRKTTIILCLLCLFAVAPACMKTSEVHATVTRTQIIVNRVFTNDTTIKPTGLSGAIDKLTLYGQVDKLAPDFCVRMVLKATDGKEYLMMELYDALCDAPSRTFNDYAEETELLSSVTPDSIKIYVHNAQFSLTSLYKTVYTGNSYPNAIDPDTLRYRRAQAKVDTLNAVNVRQNKLWRAAVTDLSLKDHTTRKRVLGLGDGDSSYGMEYYGGGIFELGETPANPIRDNSPYVDSFDWRNRHGKNWMTPVKNQGSSNCCTIFATIGCLEALVNLYYNDNTINLDLSEQQLISCCDYIYYFLGGNTITYHPYSDGLPWQLVEQQLIHICNNGIYDEDYYPFEDEDSIECKSDTLFPNELIKAADYVKNLPINPDLVKKYLIKYGPLICGKMDTIVPGKTTHGHSMTLVGYHTIHAGDTIRLAEQFGSFIVIQDSDLRVGQTFWIFKDSYGLNYSWHPENQGYYYILFNDYKLMNHPYALKTPIIRQGYYETDIHVEDRDGDGYYNWGIGLKPSNLPVWIPDEPDGDDSNPLYGPMNEYGYLESLNPNVRDTIYITTDKIFSYDQPYAPIEHYHNHVVLCNGALWEIEKEVIFHNGAKLVVRDNSVLRIKEKGVLRDANMVSQATGQIQVEGGGQIIRPTNGEIKVELGSSFELNEGSIQ